jgi:hypothetical protein
MAIQKKRDSAGAFNKRLREFGQWMNVMDMDRFVILVFMTADEKRAWAKRVLGNEDVCYFDGDDVIDVELKESAKQKVG